MAQFIVIEGIDGSGITTQTGLLASWLASVGKKVLTTSEPTTSFIGMLIQGRLSKQWIPSMLATRFLFAADSANHYETVIRPALESGSLVVSDRGLYSALAYGGVDFDPDWLKEMYKNIPIPDITFYLKVPPRMAISRLGEEGMFLKFFERETHLQKVSDNFDELTEDYPNIYVIDASKPIQEVHKEIVRILREKINLVEAS